MFKHILFVPVALSLVTTPGDESGMGRHVEWKSGNEKRKGAQGPPASQLPPTEHFPFLTSVALRFSFLVFPSDVSSAATFLHAPCPVFPNVNKLKSVGLHKGGNVLSAAPASLSALD